MNTILEVSDKAKYNVLISSIKNFNDLQDKVFLEYSIDNDTITIKVQDDTAQAFYTAKLKDVGLTYISGDKTAVVTVSKSSFQLAHNSVSEAYTKSMRINLTDRFMKFSCGSRNVKISIIPGQHFAIPLTIEAICKPLSIANPFFIEPHLPISTQSGYIYICDEGVISTDCNKRYAVCITDPIDSSVISKLKDDTKADAAVLTSMLNSALSAIKTINSKDYSISIGSNKTGKSHLILDSVSDISITIWIRLMDKHITNMMYAIINNVNTLQTTDEIKVKGDIKEALLTASKLAPSIPLTISNNKNKNIANISVSTGVFNDDFDIETDCEFNVSFRPGSVIKSLSKLDNPIIKFGLKSPAAIFYNKNVKYIFGCVLDPSISAVYEIKQQHSMVVSNP